MAKKKVLVLGANGLLGSELLSNAYLSQYEVVGHFGRSNEDHADLSMLDQTVHYLDRIKPDVIVNLVALTNVDYCEQHPNESYLGNVRVVENVVAWINQQSSKVQMVQISTDQVYDGPGLHLEDSVSLKNYYGFSKYAGELATGSIDAAILRTNLFGKSKTDQRASFTDWLYRALTNNENIQVFDDVYFSPLSMSTLCNMITRVVQQDITGVYNLGSKQGLSKADFALAFAQALDLNTEHMTRASVDDVDVIKTYRPKDMRLNVDKFEQTLAITLPNLHQEIIKVAKEYSQ